MTSDHRLHPSVVPFAESAHFLFSFLPPSPPPDPYPRDLSSAVRGRRHSSSSKLWSSGGTTFYVAPPPAAGAAAPGQPPPPPHSAGGPPHPHPHHLGPPPPQQCHPPPAALQAAAAAAAAAHAAGGPAVAGIAQNGTVYYHQPVRLNPCLSGNGGFSSIVFCSRPQGSEQNLRAN